MGTLDKLVERIERYGIYVVLIVLFVGQAISPIVPAIGQFFDKGAGIAFLSLALLFLFRYLDRNFKANSIRDLAPVDNLLQGIVESLKGKPVCERVDIFAHTSNVYFLGVQQSKAKIKHLRLLLRKMDILDEMQLPENKPDKESLRSRQQTTLDEWQSLTKSGQIDSIETAYYPFEPMMHMLIVDNKRALFGLYKLEHKFPGVSPDANDSFAVIDKNEDGRLLIRNLETAFEQIWNEFSKPTK